MVRLNPSRMLVVARITVARSPPFGRPLTVIPANAGIQRFSRFCLVALDARVRGHDTQGAWSARTGQASLAVKRRMWASSLGQHPEKLTRRATIDR